MQYAAVVEAEGITIGDFNLDLAVAGFNAGPQMHTLALLDGNGDGTFARGVFAGSPEARRPSQVATGDFNQDGKLDLVTISGGETLNDGEVNVLLNPGCR